MYKSVSFLLCLLGVISSTFAASVCNGHAEFCSRTYSNVSIIGAHNSYGVSEGSIAANQNYTVATQLNDGIRMLQVQGHLNNGSLHLCHTSCLLLDAGTFTSYLSTVKTWLDSNPNEVITILMVNTDGIPASTWADSYTASGMIQYAYTPNSVPIAYDNWPTYGELIDSGKRVVSFLAQQADIEQAPFLLDEFTNIWETPYDETDDSFPCTVNRVTGSYENKMYLMNHFLDRNITLFGETFPVPNTAELKQTNAATGRISLGSQATTCFNNWGYYPTFTLVDYYDVGDGSVFAYAAKLNGVSYTSKGVGNGATSTSSGSTSTSTSGRSNASSTSSTSSTASGSMASPTQGGGGGVTTSSQLGAGSTLQLNASLGAALVVIVLGFIVV